MIFVRDPNSQKQGLTTGVTDNRESIMKHLSELVTLIMTGHLAVITYINFSEAIFYSLDHDLCHIPQTLNMSGTHFVQERDIIEFHCFCI